MSAKDSNIELLYIEDFTAERRYIGKDTIRVICHWSTDSFILPQFRGTKIDRSQSSNTRQDVRRSFPNFLETNIGFLCNVLHLARAFLEHCRYNSAWYKASVRSQKLMMMVMTKCLRPSVLSAGKVYIFSLESFTTVEYI